jgi:hypothetical protein
LAVLVYPQPLFAFALDGPVITLHADRALPAEARDVVARATAKVRRSPLFDEERHHDVYISADAWRWRIVANVHPGAGAVALAPIGRAVFVRRAHIARNRVYRSDGRELGTDRSLDYFIAHEITHTMTADFLGAIAFWQLPEWVREGYADYVARGASLDPATLRQRLLRGDRDLDPEASGLYLRHALLVSRALRDRSVRSLLRAPPSEAAIMRLVREAE